MSKKKNTIVVIGAGTMGRGIAQLAAVSGCEVTLFDSSSEVLAEAETGLQAILSRLSAKGKQGYENADQIFARLTFAGGDYKNIRSACASSSLVIEAIVEDLKLKQELLSTLTQELSPDVIVGTNTSSLSIAALGRSVNIPGRFLGIHFFNPAPVLPLVEVVPGLATDSSCVEEVVTLLNGWGKSPVVVKDTPGFIVNRVARPFYSESLRIFEEGLADVKQIDAALKQAGKFKMGPFELMDFIGNDINLAVTESVFKEFFYDARFRPSVTQRRYVEAGYLGRKTGRGYYDYSGNQGVPQDVVVNQELAQSIFERVFAMLVNAAADALFWGIADRESLDTAMKKGVSYPLGPLEWADDIGLSHVLSVLQRLYDEYGEERYRPHVLLKRLATGGGRFSEYQRDPVV